MHGPPIRAANDVQCCGNCRQFRHVFPTFGDCRLGPDFNNVPWGTPLRQAHPRDICDRWERA